MTKNEHNLQQIEYTGAALREKNAFISSLVSHGKVLEEITQRWFKMSLIAGVKNT